MIKNPLLVNIPFPYPWKHEKIFSFLKFSGSIEDEYWPETGLVSGHKCCAERNKAYYGYNYYTANEKFRM